MESNDNQSARNTSSALLSLRDSWSSFSIEEKIKAFCALTHGEADPFFLSLNSQDQAELILSLQESQRRLWLRLLPPDDMADLIQVVPVHLRPQILQHLDAQAYKEVSALLAYKEDQAGGLMNPRFARVRPEMTADAALKYLRKQAKNVETVRYAYVLDPSQRLLGGVSLRSLFRADGDTPVHEIMHTNLITINENISQEEIARIFTQSALMALPVIDNGGRMKGIVTVDDIVQVVEEEATEDIQRLGGSEVLDAPYLKISLRQMLRKRAGWLIILFIGEMLTATAMAHFEQELERAIVLALFIPLIISSGGNSGSQASTLVVRAMALGEVRLRDWWKVFSREIVVGTSLGVLLGSIGMLRVIFWPSREELYGQYFFNIGLTVALSLLGVVLWGSLIGSMLPFLLKKARLDPATASAPFVATIVDVSGLIIYFTVASLLLRGLLL